MDSWESICLKIDNVLFNIIMDKNKRIVYNTLAQHIRAVLSIGMSLFSTRYILMALGNSDFGIFSLIGSTVAMLGFITNALVV
ncbi:MAG: hypothetical protein PUH48_04270, partial [Prevotella sp.]|nr:hypothetical protein [Prevotella sp.]